MKKHLKSVAILVAVFAILALGAFLVWRPGDKDPPPRRKGPVMLVQKGAKAGAVKKYERRAPPEMVVVKDAKGREGKVLNGRRVGGGDDVFRDSDGKPYPEKDQRLMRAARAAIDNDDVKAARALAAEALASKNEELRGMAVEALGWFGKDCLAELTPFLSDPSEEIADNARGEMVNGLQEIDDESEKAGAIELVLGTVRNKDALEDVANELVGIDELAAVQVIVNVIEDGRNPAAAAAAREVYDTITGDPYKGVDAAEAWLQKNYEPADK